MVWAGKFEFPYPFRGLHDILSIVAIPVSLRPHIKELSLITSADLSAYKDSLIPPAVPAVGNMKLLIFSFWLSVRGSTRIKR